MTQMINPASVVEQVQEIERLRKIEAAARELCFNKAGSTKHFWSRLDALCKVLTDSAEVKP